MSKDKSTKAAQSTWRKVWNIASIVLVAIVVLIAVLLMGAKVIGLKTYSVISPSMKPAYNVGDLVYVKKVAIDEIPEKIQVGDAISFLLDENLTVATHRVIEIDADSSYIRTKGDANDTPDANPVHFQNLIGKVVFKLPLLGYVADWVQNPPGTYIAVTVGAVLLILVFLPDMIGKRVKSKRGAAAPPETVPPAENTPDESEVETNDAPPVEEKPDGNDESAQ